MRPLLAVAACVAILFALLFAGCASPFEFVDHGCRIDPQSCR